MTGTNGGPEQSGPSPVDAGQWLPTIDLLNGNAVTMDICEPCWLYAGRITELDGEGLSWRFAYRTPWLRASDPMYQRLLDYLGGAVQIDAKTVADPDMMFGEAELSLYEPLVERGGE